MEKSKGCASTYKNVVGNILAAVASHHQGIPDSVAADRRAIQAIIDRIVVSHPTVTAAEAGIEHAHGIIGGFRLIIFRNIIAPDIVSP